MRHGAPILAVAAGLVLCAAPAGAAACRAHAELEPARAFVGQQVIHRQIIVSPGGVAPRWTRPASFPGFRVERLETGASAARVSVERDSAVRLEVPTALFAARAGRWRLPDARLRCAGEELVLAGPSFEALPPPTVGRPPEWTGVVGVLSVAASAEERVDIGDSVRVHVTLRGMANLWDAQPRLLVEPAETEVFGREPRISLQGAGPLHGIRHDTFDLVPRRPGTLRVAPLRIAYLDPERGRYGMAESEPLVIRVVERAPAGAAPADVPDPPAGRATGCSVGRGAAWALAAALILATVQLRRWRARRRDPVREALRTSSRARDVDARSAALERGLRAWLAQRGLDPTGRATEDGLESSPEDGVRAAREALEELERVRFGRAGDAPDLDTIHATLARCVRG